MGRVSNLCYTDNKKRIAIGFDKYQWILQRAQNYNYYPTLPHLFLALFDDEVKEITNHDIKAVLEAFSEAERHIYELSKDIKLPQRSV